MRIAHLAFSLALGLIAPALGQAAPFSELATADAAGTRLVFNNQSISPILVTIGSGEQHGVALTVGRFEKETAVIQCMASSSKETPTLTVSVEGRSTPLKTESADLSSGASAVWISSARRGRAKLQRLVSRNRPGTQVVHRSLKESPQYFAAIRFSRLILVELQDLSRLSAEHVEVLLKTAASGADLVIAAGESDGVWAQLRKISGIKVGASQPSGPELLMALPRTTSRRSLGAGLAAQSMVNVDGSPLVVKAKYGLGSIRVLGVGFQHLETGRISDALFSSTPDALGDVIAWLVRTTDLSNQGTSIVGVHVIVLLFLLPLGMWLLRKRVILAIALCPAWAIGASFVPAHLDAFSIVNARAVVIPAPAGQIAVGVFELIGHQGGYQTFDFGAHALGIDEIRGGGGCLLVGPESSALVLQTLPGGHYRMVFVASLKEGAVGEEKVAVLGGSPGSAAFGSIIRRRSRPMSLSIGEEIQEFDTYYLDAPNPTE